MMRQARRRERTRRRSPGLAIRRKRERKGLSLRRQRLRRQKTRQARPARSEMQIRKIRKPAGRRKSFLRLRMVCLRRMSRRKGRKIPQQTARNGKLLAVGPKTRSAAQHRSLQHAKIRTPAPYLYFRPL